MAGNIFNSNDPLDSWLRRGGSDLDVPLTTLPESAVSAPQTGLSPSDFPESASIQNPVTTGSNPGDFLSGSETGAILAFGKKNFADFTNEGWIQGLDNASGTYKWLLGSASAYVDFGVTSANILTFTVGSNPSTSNAIRINDASSSAWPAIDLRRSVGTGSGIYIQNDSPTGYSLDILNSSNTSAIHVISSGSGSSVVPLQLQNNTATNTNYYKVAEYRGGSSPAVSVTHWVGTTSPNGVVTASAGSTLQSDDGKVYVNTDGSTAWSELGAGDVTQTFGWFSCYANNVTLPLTTLVDMASIQASMSPDGQDIYIAVHPAADSTIRVQRWSKDATTGAFYPNAGDSVITANSFSNVEYCGIAVGASYVWLVGLNNAGTDIRITRYDRDLTNETGMTISGTANTNNVSFAAGNDSVLYVSGVTTSATTYVYTISGTTATRGSDFTIAPQAQYRHGFHFDGTDILFFDGTATTGIFKLKRYNTSGTLQATGNIAPTGRHSPVDGTDLFFETYPIGAGYAKSGAVYAITLRAFDQNAAGTADMYNVEYVAVDKP